MLDEAQNGDAAVRAVSKNKYDLILMDLHMPEMDGFSAAKEIRAMSADWARTVPIISVSAESGSELGEKSREAGINDHIRKPVETDALLGIISKYLKGEK